MTARALNAFCVSRPNMIIRLRQSLPPMGNSNWLAGPSLGCSAGYRQGR
jgi:hypothetical protein